MSGEPTAAGSAGRAPGSRAERMAEAVRLVVTSRERAPRSPRLEHALKRLVWRYTRECSREASSREESTEEDTDAAPS
jgi:hypothetical protein